MCSGIGPEEELKQLGIEVKIKQENVGKNMYDHLCAPCIFHAKESYDYLASPIWSLPSLIRYLITGTGPMTTNVCIN